MKCHFAIEKQVTEWSYLSTQQHADPFNTIKPDVIYSAFFRAPRTGNEHPIGKIEPDTNYCWQVLLQPTFNDWVLVFEATGARA